MKRTALVAVLVLPLLLAACGDDSEDSEDDSKDDSPSQTLPPEEAEVREALVASFFDPSCDLLTDDYLLEKAFLADTVDEACTEHMQSWVEPQYGEDDVLVSDIQISGDVATAVVGSDVVNITTTYELTRMEGTWLISCDDFSCDRLDETSEEPSAEVS
jgi:hypothetical protein